MAQQSPPSCNDQFYKSTDDDTGKMSLNDLMKMCGGENATAADTNRTSCMDIVDNPSGGGSTDFEKIAASMNLSSECTRAAAESFDQASNSYSQSSASSSIATQASSQDTASTIVITPFGGGGGGGHKSSSAASQAQTQAFDSAGQSASQSARKSSFEKGCGTLELNMVEDLRSRNNLKCSLNETAVESTTNVNANATVSVTSSIELSDAYKTAVITRNATLINNITRKDPVQSVNRMFDKIENSGMSQETIDKKIDALQAFVDKAYNTQSDMVNAITAAERKLLVPTMQLTNVKIINSANVKIKKVMTVDASQMETLKENFKQVALTEAKKEISKEADFDGANRIFASENVKSVLNKKINDQQNDIEAEINRINAVESTVTNGGANIVIDAKGVELILNNVTLDNNLEIDIQSDMIIKNARQKGAEVAKEIMNEVYDLTIQSDKIKSSDPGLADIIKNIPELKTTVRDTSIDPELMKEMGASNAEIAKVTTEAGTKAAEPGSGGGFKLDLFWGGLLAMIAILMILRFIPIFPQPTKFFVMIGTFALLVYWIFAKIMNWFPFMFGFSTFKNRRSGMAMRTMPDPYAKMIFGHKERRTVNTNMPGRMRLAQAIENFHAESKAIKEMRTMPSANVFEYSKMFNRKSNPLKHYKNKGPKAYR